MLTRNATQDARIWTNDDEIVYAEICGRNYVQLTSPDAAPTFLSLLVGALEGRNSNDEFTDVKINISHIQQLTRSRINITLDAAWKHSGDSYTNEHMTAVFVAQ
jgi:hypothetical protein